MVVERLSYDAWGLRRQPDGTLDPAGAITSQATRGFTGHEHLAEVGLIHMNGRVYDPLLGRFGTPDPMTENPFSTQGWNRYAYVGNSPLNFTDPSGYCFLGCFWKPIFKAVQKLFQKVPILGSILQIAAASICGPPCAALASAFVTGITSGDLGLAIKAGITSFITAHAFTAVGNATAHGTLEFMSPAHVANMAGHALVGCGSAAASGGKCGAGALSGAAGSFAGPMLANAGMNNVVSHAVVGGAAAVAGGGKFANGAVTAAFGYLFNQMAGQGHNGGPPLEVEGVARPPSLGLLRATPLTLLLASLFETVTPVTTGLDPADLSGWGNPRTLQDHFDRHGGDFGAANPRDYAAMARDFFNQGVGHLPTRIDPTNGTIRIYDPATNSFGAYSAGGYTRTFFRPNSPTYFDRQPGNLVPLP